MPGLIDTHIHFYDVRTVSDADSLRAFEENELPGKLESFLDHGITTIKSVGDPTDGILNTRARIAAGTLRGPRLLATGCGITGRDGHPPPPPSSAAIPGRVNGSRERSTASSRSATWCTISLTARWTPSNSCRKARAHTPADRRTSGGIPPSRTVSRWNGSPPRSPSSRDRGRARAGAFASPSTPPSKPRHARRSSRGGRPGARCHRRAPHRPPRSSS